MATSAAAATKTIIHVAGYSSCGFYRRAASVVASLSLLFPNKLQLVDHEFKTRDEYRDWLINDINFRNRVSSCEGKAGNLRANSHSSSPFCWIGSGTEASVDAATEFVGGCDDCLDWCRAFATPAPSGPKKEEATMVPDGHSPGHSYDYDLLVIGGGSGGLAASKEASALGAKVAVLDYVKPSPAGSKWGLGGTCVNVGCIPKKLMHNAALLAESSKVDAPHYGIGVTPETEEAWMGMSQDNVAKDHSWDTLKNNVQNHIRGLNFKYRVDLREKEVTYLNQLGSFLDEHTLETVDKKGNKGTVTFSRCLIAVGGRPTPVSCEGGELAISSDDVFAMDADPGKVLCVGASYISLECAGFLRGIGKDVTVAVRSILLRGFDRECADLIGTYMKKEGINFREKVVPSKLEKTDDGRIKCTFSDGTSDVYDTVLGAIGRSGDTGKLKLSNVGIAVNPKNDKISAKFEQTSTPNIYAIGDVMDGCPELTPVAIHAGKALSRRLFGGSSAPMDYRNVCTTVFTPIEYSTVGYSEDDAFAEFGKENCVVYHKYFVPLEWSISPTRGHHQGFCKAIVDKFTNKVLGLHYLGPNAGEVMQGFGTAMKLGCTFEDIVETVGIHPTTAEEITTLTITKDSGEDAAAGGC
jgi:thioredoxin/glutathione reductase (selenoprotein)